MQFCEKWGDFLLIEIEYSIDMVRLKTRIHNSIMNDFVVKNLDLEPNVKYWNDFKFAGYRHNWWIEQDPLRKEFEDENGDMKLSTIGQPYSYWVGYHHNSEKPTDVHNLVIEFNPNKCLPHGLLDLILSTFFNTLSTEIVSVDVAMDFPININRLIIDKYRKRTYKLFDNGGDDKTHYLGKGDGRIKIYNKAKESGLDGDLTRYEISKEIRLPIASVIDEGYEFEGELVPVSWLEGKSIEVEDKTLSALIWAVVEGYPVSELSRVYKDKIRKLMREYTELEFDKKKISQTIRTWFKGYSRLYVYNYNTKNDVNKV